MRPVHTITSARFHKRAPRKRCGDIANLPATTIDAQVICITRR